MKSLLTARAFLGGLLALSLLATGCKKELDDYYTAQGPQYPTLLTTNALGTATKYATGETVTFELQFAQQTNPIKQVVILQKVEPARDSAIVQTLPYAPGFSKRKNLDTLLVSYVVPVGTNKALVRVVPAWTATTARPKPAVSTSASPKPRLPSTSIPGPPT